MLEVFEQEDGRFAVRDIGGARLDDVVGVFDTREEADLWIMSGGGLGGEQTYLKPGGSQGLG